MVKSLSIEGFRGFSKKCNIEFAIPNDKEGSGFTFIVGSNNSGKSTISEVLQAFNKCYVSGHTLSGPSFSEGKRNGRLDRVTLSLTMSDNSSIEMKTVVSGGSEVDVTCTNQCVISNLKCFVLKSRRSVAQEFPNSKMNKTDYERNPEFGNRNPFLPGFEYRLNTMMKNKSKNRSIDKKITGI